MTGRGSERGGGAGQGSRARFTAEPRPARRGAGALEEMFVDEQLPHDVTLSVKARQSPAPRAPREEPPPKASRAAERRPAREEPFDGTDTGLAAAEGASAQMSLAAGILTCVKGHEQGLALPLLEGAYTVGRGRENSFVLKDIAASRQHLRLEVIGRRVRVTDLGSGNGTRLNGTALREAYLDTGDLLEIGNSALRFERATHRTSEAGLSPSTAPKARPASTRELSASRPLSPEALWADDEPQQRLSDVIPEDAPLRSVAVPRAADALAKTAARESPLGGGQANGAHGPPAGEESLLAPQAMASSLEDEVPPRVPPLPPPPAPPRPQGPKGTAGEATSSLPRGLVLALILGAIGLLVAGTALWVLPGPSASLAGSPRDDAALARAKVELALAAEAIEAGLPDVALRHAERAASLDRANPAAVALEASLRAQLKARAELDAMPPAELAPEEPPRAAAPTPAAPPASTAPPPSAADAPDATQTSSAAAAAAEPLLPGEEQVVPLPAAPAAEPAVVKAPERKSSPRKRRSSSGKKRRQRRVMSDSEAGDLYRRAVRLVRDDDEKQGCALMSRIAEEAPEGSNWRVKAAAGVDRYGCR